MGSSSRHLISYSCTIIRRGNLEAVAAILDKKPELISCLAKAPPKKDDGQSPLMVAIKSDNLEVAHLLLDRGRR